MLPTEQYICATQSFTKVSIKKILSILGVLTYLRFVEKNLWMDENQEL